MKRMVQILAFILALTLTLGMVSFPASAEEENQTPGCKVLVWSDANGEHVTPYTDFGGWDRVWADSIGTNEYRLYNAEYGIYRDYYSAGFVSRYLASEDEGEHGLALVKIGDVVNGSTPNTYEMKIDATINFSWKAGIAGPSTFYPVQGIIFYDPNSTSDAPVAASINSSALSSHWYGAYPPACHVSGADGAALYEAMMSGMVSIKTEVREHNYQGGACTVCGAEAPACPHNGFDSATGICADCGENAAIASVSGSGTAYFLDFQAALDAWVDGSTLTLLADVTYDAGNIEILNKSVILDLNGKKLSLDPNSAKNIWVGDMELVMEDENGNFLDEPMEITIPGELTIRDTQGGGSLDAYHLSVVVYGTFRLEGGTLEKAVSVDRSGTMYMTGGKIIGQNANGMGHAINLYGTLNISGGEVTGSFGISAGSDSVVNISGSPIITGKDRDERVFGTALRSGKDASVTVSGTPVFTGGSLGVFSVNNPIVFNTQPADGTWSVHMSTDDITANAGVFAIPGEGMDLDPAKFVSLVENYYVAKNDDGALYLAECDHTAEIAVCNGDGTHDVTCPCGSTLIQDNTPCSGGTASCTEKATCALCGGEYGDVLPHTFNPMLGTCGNCGTFLAEASLTVGRLTTYYETAQAAADAGFGSRHTVTLCKDVTYTNKYLTVREGCTLDLAGFTLASDTYMALYVEGTAAITDSVGTGAIHAKGDYSWGVWVQGNLTLTEEVSITAAQSFYYNSGKLDLSALEDPTPYTVYMGKTGSGVYDSIDLPEGYVLHANGSQVALDQIVGFSTVLTVDVCDAHEFDSATAKCALCGTQAAVAVTADGETQCYMSYHPVTEILFGAPENGVVSIKMYRDMTYGNSTGSLNFPHGTVTLDLNGCTMEPPIVMNGGTLTIMDSAESKGTIVNSSGNMMHISGGKVIIDESADCLGQAEGHKAWYIDSLNNDQSFSIGCTGTEDIVLPEGVMAVDISSGTITNALDAQTSRIYLHVHADEDRNHVCDGGCIVFQGDHEAAEGSHDCAYCGMPVSQCADADKDHKCDVCGETLSECVDENMDYKCDICGKDLEKPEDPTDPTDPEQPEKPVIEDVTRLAGANRWETSLKVADEMKANLGLEKFDAIIIASGNDFADALAGSYLSTVKNAPILLGWGKGGKYVTLDEANIAYIKANLAEGGTVYILGGKNAVPELYENELKGFKVVRLGGANRFETNLLILAEAGVAEGSEILVCTSTNFADSLSASATAKPILLVFNEYGKLYGKQPEFLAKLQNCTFTVIGGESAVSADLAKAIEAYGKVERLAGANRFETSVLVAQKYFASPETAVLAYAWNYPDGLCGGSLAFSLKAPLILTMTKYEAKAAEYMTKAGIEIGLVLGGDTLISDDAVRAIFAMDAADEIVKK